MSNIARRAMLVNLRVSVWSARKQDKQVSREVADNHGSDERMGRFNKSLLDKSALASVQTTVSTMREFHYANTLPWSDAGPRILPASNYMAYMAKMRELRGQFEGAAAEFCGAYAQHVRDAERRLGDLYRPQDYPTQAELERAFAVDVQVIPMPDAEDFRCELGDLEEARIRRDIEGRVEETIAAAHRSLWERCHEAVEHMVERLNAYQKGTDGRASGIFRDSLVGNVRELVELLPRLNITGDPALEAMRRRIERELVQEEPATLRENDTVRRHVADAAASILADMAGYCEAPTVATE